MRKKVTAKKSPAARKRPHWGGKRTPKVTAKVTPKKRARPSSAKADHVDLSEPQESSWRQIFLDHLSKWGNVSAACRAAQVTRTAAYRARKHDEAFDAAWDEVINAVLDSMEEEAIRRGRDGLVKPYFYEGARADKGEFREYSDTLLMFMLKAHRPTKYRERVSVDTCPWPAEDYDLLTTAELELVASGKMGPEQLGAAIAAHKRALLA